jgi:hypothetical protein
MRILLSSIGSDGDVQPLVALALALPALGNEPVALAAPNFAGREGHSGRAAGPAASMSGKAPCEWRRTNIANRTAAGCESSRGTPSGRQSQQETRCGARMRLDARWRIRQHALGAES